MNLFIYLQIASIEHTRFSHPMQSWIKTNYPSTTLFDADNCSDEIIIKHGLDLMGEAQKIVLLIDADPNQKMGNITPFLEKILRTTDKETAVFFNGTHTMAERLIKHIKCTLYQGSSEEAMRETVNSLFKGD